MSGAGFNREAVALHHARAFLRTDPDAKEAVHLPGGAGPPCPANDYYPPR